MRKNIFKSAGFLKWIASVASFLAMTAALSAQAADNYTLDPQHTYVQWKIDHEGFSQQTGKWMASGTLLLDEKKPQRSKVNATIQTATLVTGLPELEKHLKGKLFFDVVRFPTATFVSDKIEIVTKKTAKVYGTLTLHGVSKPVVLKVTLNKKGINPITNKKTVGFSATTTIKRSDFGMTTLLPGLGDTVRIIIGAEAYR